MDKRRQIIKTMEFKIIVLVVLGLVMSIFVFPVNVKYAIAIIAILLLYGTLNIWQIENKYKKGLYRFVSMECKSATESRDIITMAPGAVRSVTGNKRKNYDFLFEGELSDGQVMSIVIKSGRDGTDYSVGLNYLLCFDISYSETLSSNNMVAALPYSPSVDGEIIDIPVTEVEEINAAPLDSVIIIPDVDTTTDADNIAKKEILFRALNKEE